MDQRAIIARLNIEHFRRKLADENDEATRQTIMRLIVDEEARLAALDDPPDSTSRRTTETNDEYRQQAGDAQTSANNAETDGDRAAWLRVVQSWLGLIRSQPQTKQENFDAKAKAQGTGQGNSGSSH
ncbi:MAG: hypothetical protein Q8M24_21755 [Pseudolabrys sp.]|nr:hypothetical protein [Pseudolabrys sp.]MDP2298076.1 hypothetical protein [Pseudolabrys sp.]